MADQEKDLMTGLVTDLTTDQENDLMTDLIADLTTDMMIVHLLADNPTSGPDS